MQGWCKRRMGVQEIDNLLWNNLQETSHFKQLIDLAKQVLEIFLHLNLINVENNGGPKKQKLNEIYISVKF